MYIRTYKKFEFMEQANNKQMWSFPWKYKESFIIAFSLLILGLVLEYIRNGVFVVAPSYPGNLYALGAIVIFILVMQNLAKTPFVKWLSSVPAAISAICMLTVLILAMGFIPQEETNQVHTFMGRLGLTHIVRSYTYVILSIYLLVILGFTTARRLFPFNFKNFAFMLNHLGLWIVLAAGSLGMGDTIKCYMAVNEGQTSWEAFDVNNQYYELPIAIKLNEFTIDEYAPNIALVDLKTLKIIKEKKNKKLPEARLGLKTTLGDWTITITKFLPNATKANEDFIATKDSATIPAAFVNAENKSTGAIKTGWICSESGNQHPVTLVLDNEVMLYLSKPVAKRYRSSVTLYSKDSKQPKNCDVEVNKPVSMAGWEIYQNSFNKGPHKGANSSTFELIYDPWLKYVYTGIYMLLAGALLLFWHGKLRKTK